MRPCREPRKASYLGAFAGIAAVVAFGAYGAGITDSASAIEAAKRYLKARCTTETPCKFKPEHEGKQWRVWVQMTKRYAANEAPRPYPGGTLILYFDAQGNLTRRLEAE
jgi:hypothetical protein